MRVPINMGVKGRVTATLTNIETGEKQEVKGQPTETVSLSVGLTNILWVEVRE